MSIQSIFDNHTDSVVLVFAGALDRDKVFSAPEPDFLKWLDRAIDLDVIISGGAAADDQLGAKERLAWSLYGKALELTRDLFDLYKTDAALFQKLAGQMTFLPVFLTHHPDNERFNRHFLQISQLAQEGMKNGCQRIPQRLARQSWPIRYAHAIRETIDSTLDSYADESPIWAERYQCAVKPPSRLRPWEKAARNPSGDEARKRWGFPSYADSHKILPRWTKTLEHLRRPFNSEHVLDYWRTGKAMVMEELPGFHLRPEWEGYRRRHYKTGSKRGAVQHAIFKDILAALRTIAGRRAKKGALAMRIFLLSYPAGILTNRDGNRVETKIAFVKPFGKRPGELRERTTVRQFACCSGRGRPRSGVVRPRDAEICGAHFSQP